MDINVSMNVDTSPNSLKDACIVELVTSAKSDGKKMSSIGIRNIYYA